jgi:hypothetical protein
MPTIHKPCLYSGVIASQHIIFKHQVNDFAIAAPDQRTADILLFDMCDKKLTMLIKCQGLLDMFNSIDVIQMHHYIKINCNTYITKFCAKCLDSWLNKLHIADDRPIPLPINSTWLKKFNAAIGPYNPKEQVKLEAAMQIKYCGGVG